LNFEEGVCAMEMVAFLAGEEHTDHPACTSPVIAAFLRSWNDALDDGDRQRLKPWLPRVIDTRDGRDEARVWLVIDWLIRSYTPAWLELAGLTDCATQLRGLKTIGDLEAVSDARPVIDRARAYAAAAGAAAGAAAWDAAGAAAWAAARAAAWDALDSTKRELQKSAEGLLERMISPPVPA
jgi:hypothetical protein